MRRRTFLAALPAAALAGPALAQSRGENPNRDRPDVRGGDRVDGATFASRSAAWGLHGAAATAHPLASLAAIEILKAGGSAVDAAIAANAVLGLCEPIACGVGGDCFVMLWDPRTRKVEGLNGSGRSPKALSLETVRARSKNGMIASHGAISVSVPGAVDAWWTLHQRYGKLAWKDLFAPAIAHAEEGHAVTQNVAFYFDRSLTSFTRPTAGIEEVENFKKTWAASGKTPREGELFRNPDLANTLERIGQNGRDEFYRGQSAKVMVDYLKRQGSAYSLEDFAAHRSDWFEPACVAYRKGYELCELPPNTQGFAALQMVNILKNVDLAQWERGSPEVLHYITEAKRLAHADVAKFYADPSFAPFPMDLLSDEYGKKRFALIDPKRATPEFAPGEPKSEPKLEGPGDTTYMTVVDKDGLMVSLIQSNYRGMGSGLTPDGLGFMFQDRGELYSLDARHANVYALGKRPFQTIIPAFVKKDGQPYMTLGLMGGAMQPQGHVQVLINLVDYGMNLQEAGDAARLNHEGGREPTEPASGPTIDPLGTLYVEPGIPAATVAALQAMGHKVEVVKDGAMFGGYQAIARDPKTGVLTGATEMRKDGQAQGY